MLRKSNLGEVLGGKCRGEPIQEPKGRAGDHSHNWVAHIPHPHEVQGEEEHVRNQHSGQSEERKMHRN